VILVLLACAYPEKAPPPTTFTTAGGRYVIAYTTSPSPVPLSQLFEIEATVTDAKTGAPVDGATVRIDARMPQHGHGMATKPVDDPGPHTDNRYVTKGMKFHMPGDWTIRFDVDGPAGSDSVDVQHKL
jgi:hypothetical protein